MYQKPLKTNDAYLEQFKEYWATAEAASGQNCLVPNIMKTSKKYRNLDSNEWIEATKALYFFVHSNRICFGSKVQEVSEGVVLGADNYPLTLEQAYRILNDTQQRLNADRVRRNG